MGYSYKTIIVGDVADYKLDDGCWVKSKACVQDGVLYQFKTRGWKLWSDLVYRTVHPSTGNIAPRRSDHYKESLNLFEDFDSFVDWCQDQHGYMNKESNYKYWQLDKDILFPGNKNYGPDTCVFLPNDVNSLLITGRSRSSTSGLPLGVSHYFRDREQYVASCAVKGNKSGHLSGMFKDPMKAHAAWQAAKIGEIRRHSERDDLSEQVKEALFRRALSIQADLLYEKETKFY